MSKTDQNKERTRNVYLIDGGKGGVGKTFAAALQVSASKKNGRSVRIIDTDQGNASLKAQYQEAERLVVSDGKSMAKLIRVIAEWHADAEGSDDLVIDLGAGMSDHLAEYLEMAGIADEISITLVFSITSSRDSAIKLKQAFDALNGTRIKWLIVKNEKEGECEIYEGSKVRAELLKIGAKEITIKDWIGEPGGVDRMRREPFDLIMNGGSKLEPFERNFAKKWLSKIFQQFDEIAG